MSDATLNSDDDREIVIFRVGDIVCGLDIKDIQEIKKVSEMTTVHHAPDYVRGVINLRGQIVTVIDVRKRIRMEINDAAETLQVIIVHNREELIGLLVDDIDDAVQVEKELLQPPPANIGTVEGYFFTAVYKMENQLVSIIDKGRILEEQHADVVQESV